MFCTSPSANLDGRCHVQFEGVCQAIVCKRPIIAFEVDVYLFQHPFLAAILVLQRDFALKWENRTQMTQVNADLHRFNQRKSAKPRSGHQRNQRAIIKVTLSYYLGGAFLEGAVSSGMKAANRLTARL